MFDDISQDTIIYVVLTILVYSGFGSWLIGRLTRSRADERKDARIAIGENLQLMDAMRRTREHASPDEKRDFDLMWARMMAETTSRIQELNGDASERVASPERRYLILPTPKSAFGAVMSMVFAACVYLSIGALLALAVLYANGEIDPAGNAQDLDYALRVAGFSLALAAVALLARFGAFQSFKSVLKRQAKRLAEAKDAVKAVGAKAADTVADVVRRDPTPTAPAPMATPKTAAPRASGPAAAPPPARAASQASSSSSSSTQSPAPSQMSKPAPASSGAAAPARVESATPASQPQTTPSRTPHPTPASSSTNSPATTPGRGATPSPTPAPQKAPSQSTKPTSASSSPSSPASAPGRAPSPTQTSQSQTAPSQTPTPTQPTTKKP